MSPTERKKVCPSGKRGDQSLHKKRSFHRDTEKGIWAARELKSK